MKNECSIVRDLLPLYMEELLSEESADFVSRHLSSCKACQAEHITMSEPIEPIMDTGIAPLKRIKKKLFAKKIQTILLTTALILVLTLSIFGFLTAPKYYEYSSDLLTVTNADNGAVIITFDERITGYRIVQDNVPAGENQSYHIEAWTTVWDTFFLNRGQQYAVIEPDTSSPVLLYYVQNYQNGTTNAEDVLIYGDPGVSGEGVISLPGLSLGYLLVLAFAIFTLCFILLLILRKHKKVRIWLERITLLPLAYGIGHFCVLQFEMSSFSVMRDFCLISLISILVYCAMLFAVNLFYLKKEIKETECFLK